MRLYQAYSEELSKIDLMFVDNIKDNVKQIRIAVTFNVGEIGFNLELYYGRTSDDKINILQCCAAWICNYL